MSWFLSSEIGHASPFPRAEKYEFADSVRINCASRSATAAVEVWMRSATSSYSGEVGILSGGFMRTSFRLPLAALLAVVGGCSTEARDQTGSVPERDLTLATPAVEIKIASPVERRQVRATRPVMARRSSPSRPKVTLAVVTAPPAGLEAASARSLAVPAPVDQPADTASVPENDRELFPGKTITVIPAGGGPSIGSDGVDELSGPQGRPMVARSGGGTCRGRGRGPGIGIAAAPRPNFR